MKLCLSWVVGILAVTIDGLRLTSKLNKQKTTLEQMQWWQTAEKDKPLHDKYVVFTFDSAGVNNKRISWELAGIIAQKTGRTLVLPPPEQMPQLDFGSVSSTVDEPPTSFNHGSKTAIEDLINLKQLKGNLATLTWKEFLERTGKDLTAVKKESRDMAGFFFGGL